MAIAEAHIVGHAAGGVAGLALALKAPERLDKLVVVNGWAKADPHFLRCFDARLEPAAPCRRRGRSCAPSRSSSIPPTGFRQHSAALDAELPHQLADFPGTADDGEAHRRARRVRRDAAGSRSSPTQRLVLVADDDMLVPALAGDAAGRASCGGARDRADGWGGHACNVTDPGHLQRPRPRFPQELSTMQVGVFVPINNNGWLISENAPQYKPSFD